MVPAAGQVIAGLGWHDYASGAKPDIAWDDPLARDLLVSVLVADALTVLDQLEGSGVGWGQVSQRRRRLAETRFQAAGTWVSRCSARACSSAYRRP